MRKKGRTYLFIICSISLFVLGCRQDDTITPDIGYDYFPGTIGLYIEYDVIEIYHDDAVGVHDTAIYQLKEQIAESIVDLEGRPAFRIERFKRDSSHHVWQIADVWTATKTAEHLEKVEENVTFFRLLFSVREGKMWDGNAANVLQEERYEYLTVNEEDTINNTYFEDVTLIEQSNDVNFVLVARGYERYAKGVGLVSKYLKNISFTGGDSTLITTGEELYQTYVSHGTE